MRTVPGRTVLGGIQMNLISLSHSYGQSAFHLVLVTKYRRKVFYGKVSRKLAEILNEIGSTYNITIHALKVLPDHVHIFISIHPTLSLSRAIQLLKGISARILFSEFPQLKSAVWGDHLWSRGKFFRSVGAVTSEAVQHYIEQSQHKHRS